MKHDEWTPLSERLPKRRQLCDFLMGGTEDEPLIWMLCSATLSDVTGFHYNEVSTLWRPAAALPPGIEEYDAPQENKWAIENAGSTLPDAVICPKHGHTCWGGPCGDCQ